MSEVTNLLLTYLYPFINLACASVECPALYLFILLVQVEGVDFSGGVVVRFSPGRAICWSRPRTFEQMGLVRQKVIS